MVIVEHGRRTLREATGHGHPLWTSWVSVATISKYNYYHRSMETAKVVVHVLLSRIHSHMGTCLRNSLRSTQLIYIIIMHTHATWLASVQKKEHIVFDDQRFIYSFCFPSIYCFIVCCVCVVLYFKIGFDFWKISWFRFVYLENKLWILYISHSSECIYLTLWIHCVYNIIWWNKLEFANIWRNRRNDSIILLDVFWYIFLSYWIGWPVQLSIWTLSLLSALWCQVYEIISFISVVRDDIQFSLMYACTKARK